MKISLLLLLGSVVLLASTTVVHSITCFQCNSNFNSKCNDLFNAVGVDTCQGHQCAKTKLSGGPNGTIIVRDCFIGGSPNRCESHSEGSYSGVVCVCDTDRCNSGHVIRFPLVTSFLLASFVSLFCNL